MKSVRFKSSLIVAVATLASGCGISLPYLQNAGQLKTANDASAKFTDFQKASPDAYQTMLANQKKLEDAFEQDFQRRSDLHAEALAIDVANSKWPCIKERLTAFDQDLINQQTIVQSQLDQILAEENL